MGFYRRMPKIVRVSQECFHFGSDPHALETRPALVVETDASDYTLGAILSTFDSDGELRPITFHSQTFSGAELNYDVHDKELLAILKVFKRWRHYLKGSATPIDIVTNHKNLEYFSTTKVLTR